MHRTKWLCGLSLTACLLMTSCGTSGSTVHHLSGKVTFNGKPLPAGRIFFLPNTARGNAGQGGFAEIKDGTYDTRHNGNPTPGGALIVRIDGFDGKGAPGNPAGQALFLAYEVEVEVPRADATQDFDVPAAAAKNLPKGGGTPP
jgi:hypothetical protein